MKDIRHWECPLCAIHRNFYREMLPSWTDCACGERFWVSKYDVAETVEIFRKRDCRPTLWQRVKAWLKQ